MDKTTNTFAARLFVKIAGLFCGRMNFNECWGGFLKKVRLTSFQIIILGFLCLILLGTLLLMLPISQANGNATSFKDALFTSTSATCVTGLVVKNTATYWSLFGKCVILCLIQIGGLGIVTVAMAFSLLGRKKIGLMQRTVMQESISAFYVGGIIKFTSFIIRTVVCCELLGALLMLIGGATGSTAGGMKLTTVAVLAISAHSVLHRKKDATAFGRRIGTGVIFDAAAIFSLYFGTCVISAMAISAIEGLPFLKCMFETASAVATVGLTLGITPHLSTLSQLILIVLMFMGRVGGMTLVFATIARRHVVDPLKPEEKVQVG